MSCSKKADRYEVPQGRLDQAIIRDKWETHGVVYHKWHQGSMGADNDMQCRPRGSSGAVHLPPLHAPSTKLGWAVQPAKMRQYCSQPTTTRVPSPAPRAWGFIYRVGQPLAPISAQRRSCRDMPLHIIHDPMHASVRSDSSVCLLGHFLVGVFASESD